MKNIRVFFYLKSFGFFEVKFSIYLNRRVFVMLTSEGRPFMLLPVEGGMVTVIIPFSGLGVFPANLVLAQYVCTTERMGAWDKG